MVKFFVISCLCLRLTMNMVWLLPHMQLPWITHKLKKNRLTFSLTPIPMTGKKKDFDRVTENNRTTYDYPDDTEREWRIDSNWTSEDLDYYWNTEEQIHCDYVNFRYYERKMNPKIEEAKREGNQEYLIRLLQALVNETRETLDKCVSGFSRCIDEKQTIEMLDDFDEMEEIVEGIPEEKNGHGT